MSGCAIPSKFYCHERALCPDVLCVAILTRDASHLLLNSQLSERDRRRIRSKVMRLR